MNSKMLIAMLLSFVLISGAGQHASAANSKDFHLSSVDKKEKKKPVAPKPTPKPKPSKGKPTYYCVINYTVDKKGQEKKDKLWRTVQAKDEPAAYMQMLALVPDGCIVDYYKCVLKKK